MGYNKMNQSNGLSYDETIMKYTKINLFTITTIIHFFT